MDYESKNVLRKKYLDLLKAQKEEDRLKKSRIILKKLFLTREFKEAGQILFYASFAGEVETYEMIKESKALGKKIVLPNIEDQKGITPRLIQDLENDLFDGPYGIKCPILSKTSAVPMDAIDLVIVPGVAFDQNNNRLGRGKGYYDRFLSSLPPRIPTFGLAFDFQIIDSLPQEKHDIRVTRVVSN